jgi:hypothetical protein
MTFTISHSNLPDGSYQLRFGDVTLGYARKTEDGFFGQSLFSGEAECSTMKALKEWFAAHVAEFQGLIHASTQPDRLTVDTARRMAGMSHSMLDRYLQELRSYHPYLRGDQYAGAILKLAMETQLQWPNLPGRDHCLKVLEKYADQLPKMRQVDFEASDRARTPVYFNR